MEETRTATGSEMFSLFSLPSHNHIHNTKYLSPLEVSSIKISETIRPQHENCSLPFAVRVSKTRVLKLPKLTKLDDRGVAVRFVNRELKKPSDAP